MKGTIKYYWDAEYWHTNMFDIYQAPMLVLGVMLVVDQEALPAVDQVAHMDLWRVDLALGVLLVHHDHILHHHLAHQEPQWAVILVVHQVLPDQGPGVLVHIAADLVLGHFLGHGQDRGLDLRVVAAQVRPIIFWGICQFHGLFIQVNDVK